MHAPTSPVNGSEIEKLDGDLLEILKLAEGGVDAETRRFIEEVLKFVPQETAPAIRVFTSHTGAIDASED